MRRRLSTVAAALTLLIAAAASSAQPQRPLFPGSPPLGPGPAPGAPRPGLAPEPSTSVPFIDTHGHLLSGIGQPAHYEIAGPLALTSMDRLGIRRLLVLPPPLPRSESVPDYQQFPHVTATDPGRLSFLAGGESLNPMIQDASRGGQPTPDLQRRFETTAEAIMRAGAVGFGEMTALHLSFAPGHPYEAVPPDHPLFLFLADLAARFDVPLDLHIEIVAQDMPLPDRFRIPPNPATLGENLRAFERLLAHNRGARIVWEHVGWDNTGDMTVGLLRACWKRIRIFFCRSRSTDSACPRIARSTKAGKSARNGWRSSAPFPTASWSAPTSCTGTRRWCGCRAAGFDRS